MSAVPQFNSVRFADANVDMERRSGGEIILRSPQVLGAYPNQIGAHLRRWAAETPSAAFLVERNHKREWRTLRYDEALSAVEAVSQSILDKALAGRPIMVLSENSIDLALLTLAANYAGVPVVPVSPSYSLLSHDFAKLRNIFDIAQPGLIYAKEASLYSRALKTLPLSDEEIVFSEQDSSALPSTAFSDMLAAKPTQAVNDAFDRVNPDDPAKILFTSGSTGTPKGVTITHRMLCTIQQSIAQCWPFIEDKAPVILDWLPWSHAFGCNHNFNIVLRNGGTLYIDDGKPTPSLIERTVQNLRDVSPTVHFNAPRGFDMLLPYLERDSSLAASFFKNLDILFYAGAALPQSLWERLEAISVQVRGERVRMVTAWGATETTCSSTLVHFTIEKAGVIGNPAPGVEIKLVPSGSKLELRVRGLTVTPGYWKRPDLTEAAFDEEGYYRIGDAGKLEDPNNPAKGIVFDGRVAEDFKLQSGTWVHSSQIRIGLIAASSPLVQDAVIVGRDRNDVGALLFLNQATCNALVEDGNLNMNGLAASEKITKLLQQGIRQYNQANPASSVRIARAAILLELPSIDHGEITDKGYINQRAVTERRAAMVDQLYSVEPGPNVLVSADNA
jgi:feruloyl-CoA synthase